MTGTAYTLAIYASGNLAHHGVCPSFEDAEKGAIAWLMNLQAQINEALNQ